MNDCSRCESSSPLVACPQGARGVGSRQPATYRNQPDNKLVRRMENKAVENNKLVSMARGPNCDRIDFLAGEASTSFV